MYTKNAEFKAGIVVLLALAVFLTFLWFAGGAQSIFEKKRTIYIRFEQGYAAPAKGDSVYMNGVEVGVVSAVEQREEIRSGSQLKREDYAPFGAKPGDPITVRELYVLATVRMPQGQKIPEGTTAEISVDVTGQRTLALKPGLSPKDLDDDAIRVHPLPGTSAGGIADVARSVQTLVEKVARLVEHGDVVLDDVQAAILSAKKQIDRIDVMKIQENLTAGSEDLRKTLETVRKRMDDILDKIAGAAANAEGATADARGLVASVQADVERLVESLKQVVANVNDIVLRAGPKIDAAIEDVRKAAASTAAAAETFASLPPRARAILDQAGAELDRALKRFTETGHNLSDASEDLRAHPWLLLNKPDEKTISYENLRDATRNYVKATQAVQEATTDLKLLDERTDLSDTERKALTDAALERLKAGLERYEGTTRVLLRLLEPAREAAQSPPRR